MTIWPNHKNLEVEDQEELLLGIEVKEVTILLEQKEKVV
jgi:hypothetical protein